MRTGSVSRAGSTTSSARSRRPGKSRSAGRCTCSGVDRCTKPTDSRDGGRTAPSSRAARHCGGLDQVDQDLAAAHRRSCPHDRRRAEPPRGRLSAPSSGRRGRSPCRTRPWRPPWPRTATSCASWPTCRPASGSPTCCSPRSGSLGVVPARRRRAARERHDDADRLRDTMLARSTQTNEPARCAALLPALAMIDGPLALIEVGTSAGLCLYPDRYSYEYDGRPVGVRRDVHLRCTTSGPVPVPAGCPASPPASASTSTRCDVTDPGDLAWLRALVWPGQVETERLQRLDAAAAVVAEDPPTLLTGDLLERLPDALGAGPGGRHPRRPAHRRPALPARGSPRDVRRAGPGAAGALDRAGGLRHGAGHGGAVSGWLGAVLRALPRRPPWRTPHRTAAASTGYRWPDLDSGGSASMPRAASAFSISSHTVRTTSTRAHRLFSAATTCQRPAGWSVRSSISSTAAS